MSARLPSRPLWGDNFIDGWLDTPESDRLPLGATPDARNGFLYAIDKARRTAITGKRPGCRILNPTQMAAAPVYGLWEFRRIGADPTLLAVCNGALHEWDGASAFTARGSGWSAASPVRMTPHRRNAHIYDGTYMRRWDGTALYEVGFAAPTSAPGLATAAGPGVTGTYEGYAVWYDSVTDHESSPSATATAVAFANQVRRWTKPGGAPPANVTHWRVYARRTDTNERNFYRAGTFLVAAATGDETTSDTARINLGPKPNENDPPPGAWASLAVAKDGYGIGILPNDDSFYVSKLGDLESWHPSDRFYVDRGANDALDGGVKVIGTTTVVFKPHQTWVLNGSKPPFALDQIHDSFGLVSPDAGLQVDGIGFFGWDRVRGPYLTDLSSWTALGDTRINTFLETVNLVPDALRDIRCVHDERRNLVIWAVPTTTTRRRTLLAYHYQVDAWLPPITGLEYAALCQFTDEDGRLGVYLGDYWGRVFELFSGTSDGVPTTSPTDNLRSGTVVSATASTLTVDVSTRSLYTTGSGLAGLPVAVRSPAGVWQWRRVASNTGSVLTLDTTYGAPWTTVPSAGWRFIVGGIEWYHWTPWLDLGAVEYYKLLRHLFIEAKSAGSSHELTVTGRFNSQQGAIEDFEFTFDTATDAGVWGVSLWGSALWGSIQRSIRKKIVEMRVLTAQFRFANYEPNQEIRLSRYGLSGDVVPTLADPAES